MSPTITRDRDIPIAIIQFDDLSRVIVTDKVTYSHGWSGPVDKIRLKKHVNDITDEGLIKLALKAKEIAGAELDSLFPPNR